MKTKANSLRRNAGSFVCIGLLSPLFVMSTAESSSAESNSEYASALSPATFHSNEGISLFSKSRLLREKVSQNWQVPTHSWPYKRHSKSQLQQKLEASFSKSPHLSQPLLYNSPWEKSLHLESAWSKGHLQGSLSLHLWEETLNQGEFGESSENKVALDGSYLEYHLGNWQFGAGAINRWWGPTWQSPLILSNNARPIPSLYFSRQSPHAFKTPVLSWLGPWHITSFLGQLEADRDFAHPMIWGMRLSLSPFQGFELGFSRSAIFGGDGRDSDFETFARVVAGKDNDANQPGNQLGAIDMSYAFGNNDSGAEIYLEFAGEDEAGYFPAKKFATSGATGFINTQSGPLHWLTEYSDTTSGSFLGEGIIEDITYEHHIYTSGYKYRGRFLGAPLGGDTQSITLGSWIETNQYQAKGLLSGFWITRFEQEDLVSYRSTLWHEKNCWQALCRFTLDYLDGIPATLPESTEALNLSFAVSFKLDSIHP